MRKVTLVFSCAVFLLWCLITPPAEAEQCLIAGISGDSPPEFMNYPSDDISRITRHHQAIIGSYKFQCCGNITEWGVDVRPDGSKDDKGFYTLDLQVWRPSPTVDDSTGSGQYSLVGNNIFPSITLTSRVARLTPSPGEYVQFQPGDILGFYVVEARESDAGVPVLSTGSFSSYSVWHANVGAQYSETLVSVGTNGVLSSTLQAAPVVTVSTTKYNCPSSSTSDITTSTTQLSVYSTTIHDTKLSFTKITPTPRVSLVDDILYSGVVSSSASLCDRMINSTMLPDSSNSTLCNEINTSGNKTKFIAYIIIGSVSCLVVLIIVIVIICVRLKAKRLKVPMAVNPAYGVNLMNTDANKPRPYTNFRPDDGHVQNSVTVHMDLDPTYDIEMNSNTSYLTYHTTEEGVVTSATVVDIFSETNEPKRKEVAESSDNQSVDNFAASYDYVLN